MRIAGCDLGKASVRFVTVTVDGQGPPVVESTGLGTNTMSSDISCTATFDLTSHELTVALTGGGSGVVSSDPVGIDCGTDCSDTYTYGTAVTLSATPALPSVFSGWGGDADCPYRSRKTTKRFSRPYPARRRRDAFGALP